MKILYICSKLENFTRHSRFDKFKCWATKFRKRFQCSGQNRIGINSYGFQSCYVADPNRKKFVNFNLN
jgi:hypothetical protein